MNNLVDHLHSRSLSFFNPQKDVQLLRSRFERCKNLYRKDIRGHFGCINAIEFSNRGGFYLASGGDDKRVLVWEMERALDGDIKPTGMKGQHHSNIFTMSWSMDNRKIFSGGNDDQVIVHDVETRDTVDVFLQESPVYCVVSHPTNANEIALACEDGKALLQDLRAYAEPFCLARHSGPYLAVAYNPESPRLVATANSVEGVVLWDVRRPKIPLVRYSSGHSQRGAMSVRFNDRGDQLLALRRRLPAVLYRLPDSQPACQFDATGYYNSCTMKSCCFAGDSDQYVVSGSDDFNIYVWRIPPEELKWTDRPHLVLRGHRSIVNQVRFNPYSCLLISSGVEKAVKMWSPFPLADDCEGGICGETAEQAVERRVFTHEDYINLMLNSADGAVWMSHDYSHENVTEDARMIAFFDSLIQRELEGWDSDDDDDTNVSDPEFYARFIQESLSESDSPSAEPPPPPPPRRRNVEGRSISEVISRMRKQTPGRRPSSQSDQDAGLDPPEESSSDEDDDGEEDDDDGDDDGDGGASNLLREQPIEDVQRKLDSVRQQQQLPSASRERIRALKRRASPDPEEGTSSRVVAADTSSSSSSSSGSEQEDRITWEEFRRFKKKLVMAKRQYRRQQQHDSTDE